MHVSSLSKVQSEAIDCRKIESTSSLGDYAIVLDHGMHTIYLTEKEARTLHNALFDAIHPYPTNVRMLP